MKNKEIIDFCNKWKDAREALDYIEMEISFEDNEIFIIHLKVQTERINTQTKQLKIIHIVRQISKYEIDGQTEISMLGFLDFTMTEIFRELLFSCTQS